MLFHHVCDGSIWPKNWKSGTSLRQNLLAASSKGSPKAMFFACLSWRYKNSKGIFDKASQFALMPVGLLCQPPSGITKRILHTLAAVKPSLLHFTAAPSCSEMQTGKTKRQTTSCITTNLWTCTHPTGHANEASWLPSCFANHLECLLTTALLPS